MIGIVAASGITFVVPTSGWSFAAEIASYVAISFVVLGLLVPFLRLEPTGEHRVTASAVQGISQSKRREEAGEELGPRRE